METMRIKKEKIKKIKKEYGNIFDQILLNHVGEKDFLSYESSILKLWKGEENHERDNRK